jgi:histidyl-tRNA synthetase
MVDHYLRELGLSDVTLEINSLGCTICRPRYTTALFNFLTKNRSGLCSDCHRRLERNPLRVLDCNQEACQKLTTDGPSIQEHLCEDCERDFDQVLTTLGSLGSHYKINSKIVRGLDYYLKTTFEFTSPALGAQNAIAGGGRYDGLVRLMGGANVPGFGFAIGMERLVEVLREARKDLPPEGRRGVFVAAIGDAALTEAMKIAAALRQAGIPVDLDYEGKSLKSLMRRADKLQFRFVAILGDNELKKKVVSLRDLDTGKQEEVGISDLDSSPFLLK